MLQDGNLALTGACDLDKLGGQHLRFVQLLRNQLIIGYL
jgi:hypothetical protein